MPDELPMTPEADAHIVLDGIGYAGHDGGALARALLEVASDPVWIVDPSGCVSVWNRPFARWWTAIAGDDIERGATLGDALPAVWEALCQRALQGRSVGADVTVTMRGMERVFAIHAQPVADGGAVFMAHEMSGSTLSRSSTTGLVITWLFASDEPLQSVVTRVLEYLATSDSWDAAILWDADARRSALHHSASWFASRATADKVGPRIAGIEFAFGRGVPGRSWSTGEVVWIADILEESVIDRAEITAASGLHCVVAVPLRDSQRITGVLELFTRDVRPISARTKAMLTAAGETLGSLIERRRAEEERRRLVALVERKGAEWMQTFDAIELPMFLIALDGTIARLNRAARDLSVASYSELAGRPLRWVAEGEPWKTLGDIAEAVRDSRMSCTAQIASNDIVWDVAASFLSASDADDCRVVIVMREITEIVRLQESVRRGEQLSALGELVAGVAHEVKNPIFGMAMTLDLLEQHAGADRETRELLTVLRRWVDRLGKLMEDLLQYGRTWSMDLHPGRIDEVVRQAIEGSLPRAIDAGIEIDDRTGADDPVALMDAGRLVHAFENLVTNAIQYSPRGGRVAVDGSVSGGWVEYSVRDRGPGFDPADLQRIFQPFFTRRRGGTGLGLSIVQRIVEEHGGNVVAHNHPEGGAVVSVRLPLYRSQG